MAVVKATVFYIGDRMAVCRIDHPDGGVSVAEATIEDSGTVRVLPQTVRQVTVQITNVVIPEDASAQDEVDRFASQIKRFVQRIKKFNRAHLAGAETGRVRAQARRARRDLEEFVS